MQRSVIEQQRSAHVPEAVEVEQQLHRLLESHHFSRSTRYPALLHFLVQQAQLGNAGRLKERLIGIEVFHRAPDYDTNTDPVVRVTAAEVRKRIAQYYQELDHEHELRIDLPIGSYIPKFLPARVLQRDEQMDVPPIGGQTRPSEAGLPHSGDISASVLASEPGEAAIGPVKTSHDLVIGKTPAANAGKEASTPESPGTKTSGTETSGTDRTRRGVLFLLLASLVCILAAGTPFALSALRANLRSRALHRLWAPLDPQTPVLFVIGDHSLDETGRSLGSAPVQSSAADTILTQMNRRSQVPLDDVISLDKIHAFLTRDKRLYRDKGAGEATLEDLRSGPVVLFAGFDNRWTMQLSQQLPFRLLLPFDQYNAGIVEARNPSHRWTLNFDAPLNQVASDYGIVARYFDPMLEHSVMIVAGVGQMGTAAASEFVTEERFSREIVTAAPAGWKDGNFEIVLSAPVMDGQAGPPRIVASAYW